ncbi:uncharacterized protein LOC126908146 isoform X1 [Daktulosphaira vitifoliae]|uniref:uncharacterized protein LOC126908146 isoform X1 n=1 Tax=Daktulosphaira vitifoliae TaxID=58002 RepID=UPI0021A9F9F4|nr:uncharacterized protein LOC126908146 isoform X1 [Daktulosphaira vitifoliae]
MMTNFIHYFKLCASRFRRTIIYSCITVILALVLMGKREYLVKFVSADMVNTRPKDVWEYVSDFSNMMRLNPTIMKFIITHESANLNQWNYTVEYEEYLSQLPFVTNKIVGNFVIFKNSIPHYAIKSNHRTCFANLYCLYTHAEMQFLSTPKNGTRIVEIIKYECPWTLSRFCFNEIKYQRNKIFGQLQSMEFWQDKH